MRLLLLLLITSIMAGCGTQQAPAEGRLDVLITASSYRFLVERIGGAEVVVHDLVPPGASLHSYEPTPRQMLALAKAQVWFQVGEPLEKRVNGLKADIRIVSLQEGLSLIGEEQHSHHTCEGCSGEHDHGGVDPHIWLSPSLMILQAQHVARVLSELDPQQAATYERNVAALVQDLRELDVRLSATLSPHKDKTILISHPALAYFCRDYHLRQLSIEQAGKDPTAQQLSVLVKEARAVQIRSIIVVPQHPRRGAELLAEELDAKLVEFDPFAPDYFKSLQDLAEAIAHG